MDANLTYTEALEPIVCTLGPSGTDAEYLASRLTSKVQLYDTFRDAVEQSTKAQTFALVACGCLSESESWLDIHFESFNRIDLLHAFTTPTKTMCVARNPKATNNNRIATYRALRGLLKDFSPQHEALWTKNKVEAVESCVRAEAELCIGSLDVVTSYPELQILKKFTPPMVWCLYGKKGSEASLLLKRAASLNETMETATISSE